LHSEEEKEIVQGGRGRVFTKTKQGIGERSNDGSMILGRGNFLFLGPVGEREEGAEFEGGKGSGTKRIP